jgi:hypothetical protein
LEVERREGWKVLQWRPLRQRRRDKDYEKIVEVVDEMRGGENESWIGCGILTRLVGGKTDEGCEEVIEEETYEGKS